ncbi:MAG: restriction endonuclease subunit S [Methylococcales bacterium]|nr:restriction endonuclease subunit S [Methylococcales bacterium]
MKYQTYPAYKDSGVEWLEDVPEHWEIKRLGQFFEERREKVSDKNYAALSVTMKGIVPQLENAAKSDDGDNRKLVLKDDFVINSRSDRKGSSGVSPYDGSVSLISIVLKPKRIQPAFVHHLFRSYPFQEEFYRYGKGIVADLWSTNSSEMKNILIPEMPENEQQKIAQFLDHETAKIDTLIEKQQRLIELLKEKRQAVISHAVTKGLNPNAPMKDSGVEWLGEVPEHWAVAKLSYRYDVLLGKMLDDKKITGNHLGAYIRNTDVQWDYINDENLPEMDFKPEEQDRYSVKKGDLVVCEGGEIGRAAIWEKETSCFYQKALHRLRPVAPIKDETRFMFYILFDAVHQERFISGAGKATIAHLPAETFRQYRFAYPPYEEQKQISQFLDEQKKKFDALNLRVKEAIELMQERRTALISAAVTGKIDVRAWDAPNA